MEILGLIEKLAAEGMVEKNTPLSMAEIKAGEQRLGFSLAEDARELYRCSNGFSAFGGSLQVYPMLGEDDFCLLNASRSYRSWDWPIPPEMQIFGDDGCGEPYGFWLPPEGPKGAVVQAGGIFEEACLSLLADSFSRFLLIIFSGLLLADGKENLKELAGYGPFDRKIAMADEEFSLEKIKNLVCPGLSFSTGDPYQDRFRAEDIKGFLNSHGRS